MKDQTKKVLEMLYNLDAFAANTDLKRQWHVQWQSLFKSVEARIEEILDQKERKETKEKPKTPDA